MAAKKKPLHKARLGSYPFATVVFSITLALFVMGLCGLLVLQGRKIARNIQESIEIYVYLEKFTTEKPVKIDSILKTKNYILVKNDTLKFEFISKNIAAQKLMAELGEDFITFIGDNPLRDMYTLKIKPEYFQPEKMKQIKEDLEKIPGVFEVVYQENQIREIQQNLSRISWFLLGFTFLLLITIVILINNTIKLAMFSQRFLIRSMQLVGATTWFIKRPFLTRAAIQGFISGLIASVLLLLYIPFINFINIDGLTSQIQSLGFLQDSSSIFILLVSLCLAGTLIGIVSAFFSINRYLKLSLDELY